jgi:hypothetical protein
VTDSQPISPKLCASACSRQHKHACAHNNSKSMSCLHPMAADSAPSKCVCGDGGGGSFAFALIPRTRVEGHTYSLHRTHGVPHVHCEDPCVVTPPNLLLPSERKALETCPHQELNRVPREMQRCYRCSDCRHGSQVGRHTGRHTVQQRCMVSCTTGLRLAHSIVQSLACVSLLYQQSPGVNIWGHKYTNQGWVWSQNGISRRVQS